MRNRMLAVLAVAVACVCALPSPAFASTYVGDALDRREAAANYLGYGWAEQSTDLKNELGNEEDPDWDYNGWQAWINSMSKAFGGGYWVTSYEGAMLVDARDRAKADFEKALARLDGTYGFEGSGGGDIPDSGGTSGGSDAETVSNELVVNTYFSFNDSRAESGVMRLDASTVTYLQNFASSKNAYYVLMLSHKECYTNYLNSFDRVDASFYCFNKAPTSIVWNSRNKCYNITLPSGTSKYRIGMYTTNTAGVVSGNYHEFKILSASPNSGAIDWVSNPKFVSQVIEFKEPPAVQPTGTVPASGGTVNVYEGDTTNVSSTVNNSTTSVENSTTIYDTENNTYTTVNNITTNNNVDVSAITKRLDSINAKVGKIGTDLNSLVSGLDTDIKALFAGIGTTINNGVTTLRNQLVQVVAWLQVVDSDLHGINETVKSVSGTSASVSGDSTDLTRVEGYLSEINDKLDSSVSTSGETDLSSVTVLVDDVESQLDTIADKIGNLVNGTPTVPTLQPTSPVVVDDEQTIGQQLGAKAEELSKRFPFSLPWDVQFVLSLLVREPVAPEFDLPVIGSDDAVCHVDLSDWEPVAAVCRQATKILFALGLALRTRQLVSSWGSSGD